jgi:hypothetical protein
MRRILAILDNDAEYGKRFAAYLNEHELTGFKATAFSDLAAFRSFRKSFFVEILLAAENLAADIHEAADGAKVILLSEDGFAPAEEKRPFRAPALFKYRSAETLSREIMRLYADDGTHSVSRTQAGICEILGIYSPVNRCGKTSLAISLGLVKAARGRTLLISLEEYAGIFMEIAKEADSDFSDVIYCYLQGMYSWSRLKAAVHSFGKLDYIPPVRCMEDISQVSSEDLGRLLKRIAEESGYSTIILDFGTFGRRAAELLDLCTRIFMPVVKDSASRMKVDSFMEYLEKAGKAEIKEKTVKCELPFDTDAARENSMTNPSYYESGLLADYAGKLH